MDKVAALSAYASSDKKSDKKGSSATVSKERSVRQEASVLTLTLSSSHPRSRSSRCFSCSRSQTSRFGVNTLARGSSATPRGGGSGGGLLRTIWSQGSLWVRYGARRLNLVTGLTSSRGNAGGMRDPSTAHPSASSPRLSSLMLTVPRSQLLSAAQRQRFSCLSSARAEVRFLFACARHDVAACDVHCLY